MTDKASPEEILKLAQAFWESKILHSAAELNLFNIFAINMLVGTSGGTYTYKEIEDGLSQAGFAGIRLLKQGEHMDAVVEAFKS